MKRTSLLIGAAVLLGGVVWYVRWAVRPGDQGASVADVRVDQQP